MGREGRSQRGLRAAPLRRMEKRRRTASISSSKAWSRAHTFRFTRPQVSHARSQLPHPGTQRSRFTHYYFYIRDEMLGPIVMRVASFFPFQATYYLNGHSSSNKDLNRDQVGFRKNDNAFLAVADPSGSASGRRPTHPEVIRKRLDYWTLVLGPKFSKTRTRGDESAPLLRHQPDRILPQLHLQTAISPFTESSSAPARFGLWRLTANKISRDLRQPASPRS